MNRASRLQQIVAEHAAIRTTVIRIVLELDRLLTRPPEPEEPWTLPALVRSFREHLVRHFALEEGGGLLGDAAAYFDPEAQLEVAELIAEHRQLEHALDRLCGEIDGRFVPATTVQRCFDRELRVLVERLARHEDAENVLLQKLLGRTGNGGQHASAQSRNT